MKKYWKALINLIVALVGLGLTIFLVPRLLVFFAPFVVGWIIALIANPMVHFFESKLKIKRKAGSVVVIVLVIGLVVMGFYLAGAKLVDEVVGLAGDLPMMWEHTKADFEEISENLSVVYNRLPEDAQQALSDASGRLGEVLSNAVSSASTPTIEYVGNFAKLLPKVAIGMIMALLSSYLFVAERENIILWFRRNAPQSVVKGWVTIRRSLVKAVGGYLKAQLKIEIWMYLLLVAGLGILGVNYVLLIALLIALLDIIPFFGTGTVLVPWAIIKVLSSDYQMAIGLLIIWGVGQLVRQLIQPKIMGDSIGVAPIPTLFLLYAGYELGGVVGMIVAVPLGLIVYSMYEEGAFDTTKNSILILVNGLNRFRRLNPEDLKDSGIEPKTNKKNLHGQKDREEPHA